MFEGIISESDRLGGGATSVFEAIPPPSPRKLSTVLNMPELVGSGSGNCGARSDVGSTGSTSDVTGTTSEIAGSVGSTGSTSETAGTVGSTDSTFDTTGTALDITGSTSEILGNVGSTGSTSEIAGTGGSTGRIFEIAGTVGSTSEIAGSDGRTCSASDIAGNVGRTDSTSEIAGNVGSTDSTSGIEGAEMLGKGADKLGIATLPTSARLRRLSTTSAEIAGSSWLITDGMSRPTLTGGVATELNRSPTLTFNTDRRAGGVS
jgi:hypothetical protein